MPPIGALADNGKEEGVHCAFFGTFDGQGHAIRNLRVVCMGNKYCGLFGNVGHDFGEGYVKNLAILDAEIKGLSSCGILAGSLYGDADNVVCTGKIDSRPWACTPTPSTCRRRTSSVIPASTSSKPKAFMTETPCG